MRRPAYEAAVAAARHGTVEMLGAAALDRDGPVRPVKPPRVVTGRAAVLQRPAMLRTRSE